MCVWTRTTSKFEAAFTTAANSPCQMPNDEDGPPTLVLAVPPLPSPGLKRTPTLAPGTLAASASIWYLRVRQHMPTLQKIILKDESRLLRVIPLWTSGTASTR